MPCPAAEYDRVGFNILLDTLQAEVISETIFRANHLAGTSNIKQPNCNAGKLNDKC